MNTLTLQEFIETTLEVLESTGMEKYLPTLIPFGSEEGPLMLIEGIPADVDPREALQEVVRLGEFNNSTFFFCVRAAVDELVGGLYSPAGTEFFAIRESSKGFLAGRVPACDWWRVHPTLGAEPRPQP